jgi:YegS/Rv2252/BmrU family lipid kinase
MQVIKPNTTEDWLVLVNPNAGRRKGEKDWGRIARLLEEANISFVSVFTQRKLHAIQLTKKYIEKHYRKIIVVGGDGTLNEVINGVFSQNLYQPSDITIGMIPVGTGNDWCRMYGIELDYLSAIEIITQGFSFQQDAALAEYYDDNMPRKRYFINMAGIGYDALVAQKTNRQKERGRSNPLSYFLNIFLGLFQWRAVDTVIMFDRKQIKTNVFSLNTGINRYNGNGLKQLPFAIPNDGMLDLTIIRRIGRWKIIRSVLKLFDGSFVALPEVSTFKAKKITIESNGKNRLFLEVDGESMGHTPFAFSIIPEAVSLLIPQDAFARVAGLSHQEVNNNLKGKSG